MGKQKKQEKQRKQEKQGKQGRQDKQESREEKEQQKQREKTRTSGAPGGKEASFGEAQKAQLEKMTGEPVALLVTKMAIPTVISMLVTSVYNMADTFFVSQLGTSAAGAVGIVFSLMAIIQAVGFTLGMGAGSMVSRFLGRQEQKKAEETAAGAFYAALFIGILLTVLGLLFLDPLMGLLGATPTILPFAKEYALYILFAAPVMCASFVLNNLLRSQGRAVLSMVGLGLGGLLNIALDPLFIFTLNMGISGAAIATMISQVASFCILLFWFVRGKSLVHVRFSQAARHISVYWSIFKTGFPSLCRQGLSSIATVALNRSAAVYGDEAVAAMSIVGRIFMFVLSVMIGFGQGFQPVAGYNYGAGRKDRVKQAIRFCLIAGTLLLTALGAIGFIFAPEIMALFRKDDPKVIEIGAFALRAQCLVLPLSPLTVIGNMAFQALGRSLSASFLSSARQGIFFLPLILVLPPWLGLTGVQITQAAADVLTTLVCIPMMVFFWRWLNTQPGTDSSKTTKASKVTASKAGKSQ